MAPVSSLGDSAVCHSKPAAQTGLPGAWAPSPSLHLPSSSFGTFSPVQIRATLDRTSGRDGCPPARYVPNGGVRRRPCS